MKLKRKPYTVVLMLPEDAADNYGEDIYRALVTAATPKQGVAAARRELDKFLSERDDVGLDDLVDAAVVVMYEGHHTDINPEE